MDKRTFVLGAVKVFKEPNLTDAATGIDVRFRPDGEIALEFAALGRS